MSRIARIVVEGCPHHIIQRGNRRQDVFLNENDRLIYLRLLKENTTKYGIKIWAYCLMKNHVHLIAVPEYRDSFAKGFGQTHRNYSIIINKREGWSGHLWQERFLSFPLSDRHLYAAVRYVENNPVRAGLVHSAEDYLWSSARAHVKREENYILSDSFLCINRFDWAKYLREDAGESDNELIRKCTKTGRPMEDDEFVSEIEKHLQRVVKKKRTGPKKIKVTVT